jgi:ArsR family transcriptional regulator
VNSSRTLVLTDLEENVEVLKALADPNRLEILEILSPEIRCNCHLQDQLDIAPNLLSYHLKVLREAGLIEGTKRGRWIDYSLTSDAAEVIVAALPERLRP